MEIPIGLLAIKDYEAQILPSPVSTNEPTSRWPCSPWWPGSKLPDLASKIQTWRWWQEIRTIIPMIITMIIIYNNDDNKNNDNDNNDDNDNHNHYIMIIMMMIIIIINFHSCCHEGRPSLRGPGSWWAHPRSARGGSATWPQPGPPSPRRNDWKPWKMVIYP